MFYVLLFLLIQFANGISNITTKDPMIIDGLDWRPFRFAIFRRGYYRVFNNNVGEMVVRNLTQRLVRKYPKNFTNVNCMQDYFLHPFQYSEMAPFDYQVGRLRSRNVWEITVEFNNSLYGSVPVYCEIDKVEIDDVTVNVDIAAGVISIRRPWIKNHPLTYSPLRLLGEITTKAKWW